MARRKKTTPTTSTTLAEAFPPPPTLDTHNSLAPLGEYQMPCGHPFFIYPSDTDDGQVCVLIPTSEDNGVIKTTHEDDDYRVRDACQRADDYDNCGWEYCYVLKPNVLKALIGAVIAHTPALTKGS